MALKLRFAAFEKAVISQVFLGTLVEAISSVSSAKVCILRRFSKSSFSHLLELRCLCRFCRYEKCLKVQMRPESKANVIWKYGNRFWSISDVQLNRFDPLPAIKDDSVPPSSTSTSTSPSSTNLPLLPSSFSPGMQDRNSVIMSSSIEANVCHEAMTSIFNRVRKCLQNQRFTCKFYRQPMDPALLWLLRCKTHIDEWLKSENSVKGPPMLKKIHLKIFLKLVWPFHYPQFQYPPKQGFTPKKQMCNFKPKLLP